MRKKKYCSDGIALYYVVTATIKVLNENEKVLGCGQMELEG